MHRRLAIGGAAALLLALPAATTAHEISAVNVDCEGDAITVEGILFGETLPIDVTVTGPEGYLQVVTVTTDSFSATLPLGPNGEYSIDWPESGDFGPHAFTVECAEEPVEEQPTPTPEPTSGEELPVGGTPPPEQGGEELPVGGSGPETTLPPTDTAVDPAETSQDGGAFGPVAAFLGALIGAAWLAKPQRTRVPHRRRVR